MEAENSISSQARKGLWVSIVLGIILTLGTVFVAYQVFSSPNLANWQGISGIVLFVFMSVFAWFSAFLCYRQRPYIGIPMLIIALQLLILYVPLIVANRGTIIALVGLLIIIGISIQTLPEKRANIWIAISSVIGIIAVLLDLWVPFNRAVTTYTPWPLIGLSLAAAGFFIVLLFQYNRLHLRTKLLVTFAAVPSIVVILVGGFFLYTFVGKLTTQIEQNSITDILIQQDRINFFLDDVSDDVQFLSESVTLQTYLDALANNADPSTIAAAQEALNKEFHAFAQARSIYDQVRFLDTTGQELVRVNTDRDGNSTIVLEENLQNKAGRYYFDDSLALGKGELMISPLDLNVEQGAIEEPYKPVIRYGTPVMLDGEKAGVIITNVLADNFLNLLESETAPHYLVDEDGYYLYHPDEEKRWGRDLDTGITIQEDALALTQELYSGQTVSFNDDVNQYAYTPVILTSEDTPRWYLASALPLEIALAPVNETLTLSQTVLAISLMVTPLLALLVSGTLTRPMAKLTDAAEEISRGNLNVVVDLKNEDEFGLLAQTFNQMTYRLNDSFSTMETQVQERTRDLALAAEIGRNLSQVHDLDDLLETAVELIRHRFNLYYSQIYLISETRNQLILRAGTGEVGQQLLQQGHTLPIGPGSINGTAVSKKQPVIISDTSQDILFRANPLLPHTRSEMTVPLLIGDRAVGALNLQSAETSALSPENLPAFEAMAGQLAIAIENVNLLTEAVEARAEVETYSQRATRESWDNYLDGIQQPQTIRYDYDLQTKTASTQETAPTTWENDFSVPITFLDQQIGVIQIEANEDQQWTEEEINLMQSVAKEVGQQAENLRLLEDANRYQVEAEEAINRLTHEAWKTYQEQTSINNAFQYKSKKVTPLDDASQPSATEGFISQPLTLNDETIGELALASPEASEEEVQELITAVATQLVTHMESLRLSEQTEKALAESQQLGRELAIINHVVERVSKAAGLQDSMQIIVEELVEAIDVDQVRVTMLDNERTKLTVIAERYDTTINESALGLEIPLAGNTLTQDVINTRQSIYIPDCQTSPHTKNIREMLAEQHIQSFAVIPIVIDNVTIGTIGLDILDEQKTITDNQIKLAETLILQAATAIQKAQLFEETEARAEELAVINEVAQTVAQQTDMHEILQSVHEQIKRIMPIDSFFVSIYDASSNLLDYPYIYDNGRTYQNPPEPLSPTSQTYKVIQSGQPLLINHTQEELDELITHPQKDTIGDIQNLPASLLFIPLRTGQEISGVLSVQNYQINTYSEANIALLAGIANHVAVALENTRLLTETRQTAEREQVMREISTTINTAIDAESVLQTAAREIGRALGIETYVYLTPNIQPAEKNGTKN